MMNNEEIKKQKVLILEEDEGAASQLSSIIKNSFHISVETCLSLSDAKKLLKSDISIKFLLTTYDMADYTIDRCHELALFAKVHRPDIRQMGIGTYTKPELILGDDKVLLAGTRDLQTDFAELLHPEKVVSIDRKKLDAQIISLASLFGGPYDV